MTKTNFAASSNVTGNPALADREGHEGDWVLESDKAREPPRLVRSSAADNLARLVGGHQVGLL